MPGRRSGSQGELSLVITAVVFGVLAIIAGWFLGNYALNVFTGYQMDDGAQQAQSHPVSDSTLPQQPSVSDAEPTQAGVNATSLPAVTEEAPAVTSKWDEDVSSWGSGGTSPVVTATTTSPTSSSGEWYRVRVGSFSTKAEAQAAAQELAAKGYPIYVTGSGPYLVQVGAFKVKQNAERLQDELEAQGYQVSVVR